MSIITLEKSKLIEELHNEFHVPKHVIDHMKKVAYVCEILGKAMIKKKKKVNMEMLTAAAMLHDVLRVSDFRTIDIKSFKQKISKEDMKIWAALRKKYGKIGHEKAMAKILCKIGEKDLANLVAKHDFWRIDHLKGWEEKILYYADKRVEKDKVVSLKKRFEEGRKRNARKKDNNDLRMEIEKKAFLLEKEFIKIFGKLPI